MSLIHRTDQVVISIPFHDSLQSASKGYLHAHYTRVPQQPCPLPPKGIFVNRWEHLTNTGKATIVTTGRGKANNTTVALNCWPVASVLSECQNRMLHPSNYACRDIILVSLALGSCSSNSSSASSGVPLHACHPRCLLMTGDQSIFSTLFASWRFEGFSISNLALRHFGLLESGFKDKLDKKLCIQDFDFIYSGNDST